MTLKHFEKPTFNKFMLMSACALGVMVGSQNVQAEVRQGTNQNEISFITGGIGSEERAELDAEEKNHNLKLTFARTEDSAYFSDIHVQIKDKDDKVIFDEQDTGPVLFVDLPAGDYKLTATQENNSKDLTIKISDKATTEKVITW